MNKNVTKTISVLDFIVNPLAVCKRVYFSLHEIHIERQNRKTTRGQGISRTSNQLVSSSLMSPVLLVMKIDHHELNNRNLHC